MYLRDRILLTVILAWIVTGHCLAIEKPRVVVLTDITNEPDDEQSMVRFLCYANEFDVEALIATTSCWLRDKTAPEQIQKRIEAFGQVRSNFTKHAVGWPTKQALLDVVRTGVSKFGMLGVGEGNDSSGSQRIIEVVDAEDSRPVYVSIWGGANCLAQALWRVQQTRSPQELEKFVSKLRVYTISDQDDAGPWMRRTFPNLFYIVSPGYQERGGGAYHYATWVGISGDKFHGRFEGPDFSIVDNPWLDQHIRKDHGPLGALHPQTKYLMEGDTPSFLWLIPNGLHVPEHPNYGGWGGRYEFYAPPKQKWHYQQEPAIWTDAKDEVTGIDGKTYRTNQATIWRWREAYQNDFAARIDWSNIGVYENANHHPQIVLLVNRQYQAPTNNGASRFDFLSPVELSVNSGDRIQLDAAQSADPDSDSLAFKWFHYAEAGSFDGDVEITAAEQSQAQLVAPDVDTPQTIHIILEVKDGGEPALFAYRRIILMVNPH